MRLRCKNCGYFFDAERLQEKCPYCGERKVERELDAEGILKEVGKT